MKRNRTFTEGNGAGFTLLEVMVSLAIIGGLLVTLISSMNYHLDIAARHEFVTVASMLARNKLREIEARSSATKGTFPEPFSAYSFSSEIKDSDYPGISVLAVVVSRGKEEVRFTEMVEKTR